METKENERIKVMEQRIANIQEQIEVIAKVLKSEIRRNQESDEKIAKILVKQNEVLKNFVKDEGFSKEETKAIARHFLEEKQDFLHPVNCFECDKKIERDKGHRWYHGDQDDLLCTECAKVTRHTDTSYIGSFVFEEK